MTAKIAQDPGNKLKLIYLLMVLCFALALRLHHLNHESLWMDELRQTAYYPHSLSQIVVDAASQSQPPLGYWIGHFVHLLSTSDFAVRLPSAVFGTGSIVLLVILIANVTSWPLAFGFGGIAALLPFNLYYSQEARPYAIAVFFFLCMLWALNNLLTAPGDKTLIRTFILLFFSAAFLYTRSLFPLVLIVGLLLILAVWLLLLIRKEGIGLTRKKYLIAISGVTLISAVGAYLPFLKFILTKSARYVSDTSLSLNLTNFINAIVRFDVSPIWRSYVVQSEPLTYPLLFLMCLSPFSLWSSRRDSKLVLGSIVALLLPLAGLLNRFIFQIKSGMPFRPAYAGYILPLALILGAIGAQLLWSAAAKIRFGKVFRAGLIALATIFFVQALHAAWEYKSVQRKTDWRAVSSFLADAYNEKHLIIFDSLSPYGAWEPTFYGFPRYYHGNSTLLSMARLPMAAGKIARMQRTPVIVLFQWREYYLTPQSNYPIMSVPHPYMKKINYLKLCRHPRFSCAQFKGFLVIRLKEDSKNPCQDTYTVIEWLISNLPRGSWLVELHLAAASLAKQLNLKGWQQHLMQAEALTDDRRLLRVKKTAKHIRGEGFNQPIK